MKVTRKSILLLTIAVLAVVYAVQLTVTGRSPVKTFKLKEKADKITIISSDEKVLLSLEGGLWYIGEEKSAADDKKVADIVNAVSTIKTLGTISRSSSETELERYGFADVTTLEVTLEKNGKTLRTIKVGKDASGSSTTYIQLNGSSETLLATGAIRSALSVKAEDLKMKIEEPAAESPVIQPEQGELQSL